jgi:hypothetical protein
VQHMSNTVEIAYSKRAQVSTSQCESSKSFLGHCCVGIVVHRPVMFVQEDAIADLEDKLIR